MCLEILKWKYKYNEINKNYLKGYNYPTTLKLKYNRYILISI